MCCVNRLSLARSTLYVNGVVPSVGASQVSSTSSVNRLIVSTTLAARFRGTDGLACEDESVVAKWEVHGVSASEFWAFTR